MCIIRAAGPSPWFEWPTARCLSAPPSLTARDPSQQIFEQRSDAQCPVSSLPPPRSAKPSPPQPSMTEYVPIHQADPPDEKGEIPVATRPWLLKARNILICILAGYGLLNLGVLLYTHFPKPHHNPCACGQTPTEALSRGCQFDPFALAWLPDNCRDDELISDFHALGQKDNHSWSFYLFPTTEKQLSLEEVSMMAQVVGTEAHKDTVVTTTADWHYTHCLYLMRKIYRAHAAGKTIESRTDSEHHVKHCVESVLQWITTESDAAGLVGVSVIDLYED
ncbi:hypothetical protein BO78DRAFT_425919 [Aspergillus sclerotiicarbonarius CBS 121057]|uniref:Uncharacterized protein n=1 Tax=Aspergillus sclerotiicarbonarius (strain CBS 121057 / IBT 28362) TaxID=1448318 RepID=A0A319EUQ6_ASPSB|nr:hypothetical protein BO78DRAFT_425919 [Aspergillus sclerotiicarbonarius CBS 121057]